MNDILTMNDAQALTLIQAQAFRVNQTVYEAKFPDWNYGRWVFVDTTGPAWSPGILTYTSSITGQAKFQSGYAKDVPMADVNQDVQTKTFHLAAIGYQWNIEEINTTLAIAGQNLPNRRARAARLSAEKFLYDTALKGQVEKGLTGLINYTGVPTTTAPADGTGSSTLWVDAAGVGIKTPVQIVRDINIALQGIYLATMQIEMADTILLPVEAYNYIAATPYSAVTMDTILSFVQRTNIYTLTTGRPLNIGTVRELGTGAAGGTTGRMVAYKNDQDYVKFHLPMPFQFLDAYRDGPLNYSVPGIFRTGGVELLTTAAFRYIDGISQPPTP